MKPTQFTHAAILALTIVSSASVFAGDKDYGSSHHRSSYSHYHTDGKGSHHYGSYTHTYKPRVSSKRTTISGFTPRGTHKSYTSPSLRTSTYRQSGLPQNYFQLACINCQQGDKSAAASYIEKGIASLAKRSKSAAVSNKAALARSIDELRYQSRQLKAGQAVSLAKLKAAIGRANHAVASRTYKAAHHVGARSNKVVHASAEFGHSAVKDTKRDIRYTGNRVKLLGSRVGGFVSKSVSPIEH
jgi:hypothetical protein